VLKEPGMPPPDAPLTREPLSAALLGEILDRAPDAVLGVAPDGRIRYANASACALLGYAPEDFQDLDLTAIAPDAFPGPGGTGALETVLVDRHGGRIHAEMTRARVSHQGTELLFLYIRDITSRKAAEAALRRSEARFALAFNASPDAINITRLDDGTYLEVSTGFERLTGWKRDEVLGRTSVELGLWADPAERQKMTTLLKEKGEFDATLFTFRCKDGTLIKGLMSGRLVSLDGLPCLLTITRDVTVQEDAQQALGNLTDLIAAITAHVPAFISLLDRRGHMLFLNKVAPGFAMADVIGMDFLDGLTDEAKPLGAQALARILAGSSQEVYEGFGWGPDRSPRWYRSIMGPMIEKGQVVGAVLIAMDETERRRQEARLRESEDRFQALQSHTPDALFWIRVGTQGELLLEGMNPAAESILGRKAQDVAGLPFEAFCAPQLAAAFVAHDLECIAARKPLTFEEEIPGPDGSRYLSTTLVPIQDDTGRIHRIVGSARDITQKRHMEEALRLSQKLESLGVLAGGIAHDFNNLLTAIMGNLNLAQLKLPEGSPALGHLEAVENTVLKASELTRQMLAYSGKGRFSVKPQDLDAVVNGMVHLLKVSVPKGASLSIHLAGNLPAVEGDAAQIQQVVMNLVTNAADALGDKEGVIRVATREEDLDEARIRAAFPAQDLEPGPFVVLEVEDTGCGMSPGVLARIFDPFFTTKVKGRGLGLSAMLGILKGHKAGILIQSREGEGSSFQVFFPASRGTAVPRPQAAAEPVSEFSGRLLLVDDEVIILDSIGLALETLGFEVIQARDGVEALERFEAARPDLVLMDLTMPRMDGATAFAKMQALRPEVPVILSSGYDRQALEGVKPAAFVQKPYRLKELKKLLAEVLRG